MKKRIRTFCLEVILTFCKYKCITVRSFLTCINDASEEQQQIGTYYFYHSVLS